MRLLSVLGASQALTDHLCRHPEQWRELADPFLGSTRPPAYAVRDALLQAVGADPTSESPTATVPHAAAVDALRVEYRRPAHPARRPRPRPSRRCRRRIRRAVRPRRRHARGRAGDRAGRRARRRVGAPGGHRPRQVRWARAQLRVRRRRPLRVRAGRWCRRGGCGPRRDPARLPAHADLLRPHQRGHDLAGRREPPPGGQGGTSGPDSGQPPGLLRAVGEDLGVPGVAQGPPGRGGPRARAGGSCPWSSRWSGRSPTGTGSWATSRPCADACSRPFRHATPTVSSSSAQGAFATSSSPCSCCSWSTAEPMSVSATRARSRRSTRSRRAGTSVARTAKRCTRRTRSCAPSSTASSSSISAAHTSYRAMRGRCVGSAAGWASRRSRLQRSKRRGPTIAARYAGSTRSSSTVRCSRPWPAFPPPGCA